MQNITIFDPFLVIYLVSFFPKKQPYAKAAKTPPASGAKIQIQTCFNDSELPAIACNTAGAILLAGFTDVPVKPRPIKWTSVNVRPITTPAILPFPCLESVTDNITNQVNILYIWLVFLLLSNFY